MAWMMQWRATSWETGGGAGPLGATSWETGGGARPLGATSWETGGRLGARSGLSSEGPSGGVGALNNMEQRTATRRDLV